MRELVRTKRFYEINANGDRIPLIVTTAQITSQEDQNYERFVRIEAQEAYVNENYTPDSI
jgi:hypothetical protein